MPSSPWTKENVPSQQGRIAVVTGANGGLGLETTRVLAQKGAKVVMACRNQDKARKAIIQIKQDAPEAELVLAPLDLSDLQSVRAFSTSLHRDCPEGIDLLINNAGVMAIPRKETKDGFEMQLGINHLGHFALTSLLLDLLANRPNARVVTVSSNAHKMGRLNFDDLHSTTRYNKWRAYGQSKLANLLFTYELARRFDAKKLPLLATAAHPGYASTDLSSVGPSMAGSFLMSKLTTLSDALLAQTAQMGALPTLFAATDPSVQNGDYIGPDGFMEMRGHPKKVTSNTTSHDVQLAVRLWERSVKETGQDFEALGA